MGEPQNGWFVVEKVFFNMDEMGYRDYHDFGKFRNNPWIGKDRDVGMLLPGQ